MSESTHTPGWGAPRIPLICNACDWRYLVQADAVPTACPHCASPDIEVLAPGTAQFPHVAPPELVVPFAADAEVVSLQVAAFAEEIPFATEDLNPEALVGRLQRLFVPMWLVDTEAESLWQAEVGFDYEVVSHRERYVDGGGWQTQEVRENRARWEPRVGRLTRHYDNIGAPALSSHQALERVLGGYDLRAAVRYDPAALAGALVRVPDLTPVAAWPDAQLGVRRLAQEECREAAGADHLRDFRWSPSYSGSNWTLLLVPVYATHYRDDEGIARRILLNGQTGQLYGVKRGSAARAQRRALTIGAIALVIFVLSLMVALLGLLLPPLMIVGILGAVLALLIGAGALIPVGRVALFNRRQRDIPVEV
ncbi:MAG: hypothetical protein MUQ30_11435 [Anaerolineae bacterium]|nr:hypothetical protein [Anaerolineae bacterium]